MLRGSLVAQTIKNPPAMWETWVQSLGWKDSLEEGMATHSSILPWRIPWTKEPGRLQPMGLQRAGQDSDRTTTKPVVCVCSLNCTLRVYAIICVSATLQ